jgi:hypothetical protein
MSTQQRERRRRAQRGARGGRAVSQRRVGDGRRQLRASGGDGEDVPARGRVWADRHLVQEHADVAAVKLIHRSCGKPADPYLACSHCHEPLTARDITPSPPRPEAE